MFFPSSSRRSRIRLLTYLIAAFLLLTSLLLCERYENNRLRRTISNSYTQAFSELTASLDKMDTALQKGRYVTTSSMLSTLCSEVYAQSQTGQQALSRLPLANIQLEQTAEFLSTVGDYALALSKSAGRTGTYREEEHTNWVQLSQAAQTLSGQLSALELELIDGVFSIEDVEAVQSGMTGEEVPTDGFSAVEAEFPEMPSLIYDGPFSQHLIGKPAAQLEGERALDQAEAEAKVRRRLGGIELVCEGSVEGDLPAWVFSWQGPLGRCTVSLTRQGGHLLSFLTEGAPSSRNISLEDALDQAEELLEELGFQDMEGSYYQLRNNILTVNFCYEAELGEEDVSCYPDLIKVSVSMADGRLVGFEGLGWLVNHRARELEPPSVSRQQARSTVSRELTIRESGLALIPTPGQDEVLCWEFLGEAENGQQVLVYINAQTGGEEKVLLLLEDEYGTLTI